MFEGGFIRNTCSEKVSGHPATSAEQPATARHNKGLVGRKKILRKPRKETGETLECKGAGADGYGVGKTKNKG